MALLLLRVSVVAFFIHGAAAYEGSFHRLILIGVSLISISLLIGFLTPFLCVTVAAAIIANMIVNPDASGVICVIAIANAAALGLLGPGAYSVDSKLFGRRVTVFRPTNSSNRS